MAQAESSTAAVKLPKKIRTRQRQGDLSKTVEWISLAHSVPRQAVHSTPDGRFCFVPSGSVVKIYNSQTCQLVSTLEQAAPDKQAKLKDRTVTAAIVNPSNHAQLLVTSLDGHLRIWDYASGVVVKSIDLEAGISHIAPHPSLPNIFYVATTRAKRKSAGTDRTADKALTVQRVHSGEDGKHTSTRILGLKTEAADLKLSNDGNFLAVAAGQSFFVGSLAKAKPDWVRYDSLQEITCLAPHPTDDSLVVGDEGGVLKIYHCFDPTSWKPSKKENYKRGPPASARLHWHAHPVRCAAFSADGTYLVSGGEESVLVFWHLQTGAKDFLPRVGGPIAGVGLLPPTNASGEEMAVTLRDGTVLFVNVQNFALERSIASLKIEASSSKSAQKSKRLNVAVPLVVQPGTGHLVLPSSHPSSLQFYSPSKDQHIAELEIAPSNRTAPRVDSYVEPVRVERVAFSTPSADDATSWMVTYDSWQEAEFELEGFLKFWRSSSISADYELVNKVSVKAKSNVTSVSFSPAGATPRVLTTHADNSIKLWTYVPAQSDSIAAGWRCQNQFTFRKQQALSSAWSDDGSLFAVAHPFSVSLWEASSLQLVTCLSSQSGGRIHSVAFVGDGRVAAGGKLGTVVWSLLSFEEEMVLDYSAQQLVSSADQLVVLEHMPIDDHAKTKSRVMAYALARPSDSAPKTLNMPFRAEQAALLSNGDLSLACRASTGDLMLTACRAQKRSKTQLLTADDTKPFQLFDDIFGSLTMSDESIARTPSILQETNTIIRRQIMLEPGDPATKESHPGQWNHMTTLKDHLMHLGFLRCLQLLVDEKPLSTEDAEKDSILATIACILDGRYEEATLFQLYEKLHEVHAAEQHLFQEVLDAHVTLSTELHSPAHTRAQAKQTIDKIYGHVQDIKATALPLPSYKLAVQNSLTYMIMYRFHDGYKHPGYLRHNEGGHDGIKDHAHDILYLNEVDGIKNRAIMTLNYERNPDRSFLLYLAILRQVQLVQHVVNAKHQSSASRGNASIDPLLGTIVAILAGVGHSDSAWSELHTVPGVTETSHEMVSDFAQNFFHRQLAYVHMVTSHGPQWKSDNARHRNVRGDEDIKMARATAHNARRRLFEYLPNFDPKGAWPDKQIACQFAEEHLIDIWCPRKNI